MNYTIVALVEAIDFSFPNLPDKTVHRPRAQFFSIRTFRLANNIFVIFSLKLLSAVLVTNSLLSAGWQNGKIPPSHETFRNQSDYRIVFYQVPARASKKKRK